MNISDEAREILEDFFEDQPGFLFVSVSRIGDVYKINFDPVLEPPKELFLPLDKHVLLDADAAPYLTGSMLEWSPERRSFFVELPEGSVDADETVSFTFH